MPIFPSGKFKRQIHQDFLQNESFYNDDNLFKKLALTLPENEWTPELENVDVDDESDDTFSNLNDALMQTNNEGMNAAMDQKWSDEQSKPKTVEGEQVLELNENLMAFLNNQNIRSEVVLEGNPDGDWTIVAKGPNLQGQTAMIVWRMLHQYIQKRKLSLVVEIRNEGSTGPAARSQDENQLWQITLRPNTDQKQQEENQEGLEVIKK